MGHLLTPSEAVRIVASREPLHPPFRNRCRPCDAAPSDHVGPGQPSMSRSSAATAPVSFPVILAGFPIRSDLAGGGNAVSPPLVPVRPSSRDPASLPGRWRPRSQCRPSPSALASQNPSKSLSRQTSVSSRGEARLSRVEGVAVSGGFRHRAGASASTLTSFPPPPLAEPSVRIFRAGPRSRPCSRPREADSPLFRRVRPMACHRCSSGWRTYFPVRTLRFRHRHQRSLLLAYAPTTA